MVGQVHRWGTGKSKAGKKWSLKKKENNRRVNENYPFLTTGGLSYLSLSKKQHTFLGPDSPCKHRILQHVQAHWVWHLQRKAPTHMHRLCSPPHPHIAASLYQASSWNKGKMPAAIGKDLEGRDDFFLAHSHNHEKLTSHSTTTLMDLTASREQEGQE